MASPAAFISSATTGHSGPFPPTIVASGSPTVLIEGKPAARVGDVAIPHTRTALPFDTHQPIIASGSSKVLINGSPAARIGDTFQCGDIVASGAYHVIIGG